MKRRRKEKRSLHRQTFDIWQRNGVFNGEFFFFSFLFIREVYCLCLSYLPFGKKKSYCVMKWNNVLYRDLIVWKQLER